MRLLQTQGDVTKAVPAVDTAGNMGSSDRVEEQVTKPQCTGGV